VIIRYHDGIGHTLRNEAPRRVLEGEYHVETQLFAMVSTIAGDSDGSIKIHGAIEVAFLIFHIWLPISDLMRVENNHPVRLVITPSFLGVGLLDLLPCSTFTLAPHTVLADANLGTLLRRVLFIVIDRRKVSLWVRGSSVERHLSEFRLCHCARTNQ
jgi:uncharacterized MnhB-related membrane protein